MTFSYLHLAKVRSHARLRRFTDEELIQCAIDGLTATETAYKLEAGKTTITYHARRLGLVFLQKRRRLQFFEKDDELIRKCSRGEVGLSQVSQELACSYSSVRLRAEALGVVISTRSQPPKQAPKEYVVGDYDLGQQISVGKDLLLRRLRQVFGSPRDEVYPGSVKVKELA